MYTEHKMSYDDGKYHNPGTQLLDINTKQKSIFQDHVAQIKLKTQSCQEPVDNRSLETRHEPAPPLPSPFSHFLLPR
jgi:hypothetical protein